ncbi:dTDP-4-dehydrorhamnose reductase [Halobacteriovorax marinus]|uniref:dTDP-4-dehydrorhamnose reductase n=1 Tax=Halobacteriovorax marinus TaxID=97084 RepID=UPI000BC340B3|nr:dTDP-4-dehydrorhamnose reductase [Halobacteriovorax marinus]ATH06727.1 dTDP-4-dehydrorhamnose reductase [Halobacteriovorax marinus]
MIYVLGSNGQLGQSLKKVSNLNRAELTFLPSSALDITSKESLSYFFKGLKANDFIINCAAYTAVDKAETEKEKAYKVNSDALELISHFCSIHNTNLIHISTDYVFDGLQNKPINEDMKPSPINIYGHSKLSGENKIINSKCNFAIIRTSWVFSEFGNNFLKTMIRLSDQDTLNVVNDQIGSPTYAPDLAACILTVINNFAICNKNIFHYVNSSQCSWYEFSKEIMKLLESNTIVNPIPSSDYYTPAKRPKYSLLNTNKIELMLGLKIRSWKEALKFCIKEIHNA